MFFLKVSKHWGHVAEPEELKDCLTLLYSMGRMLGRIILWKLNCQMTPNYRGYLRKKVLKHNSYFDIFLKLKMVKKLTI